MIVVAIIAVAALVVGPNVIRGIPGYRVNSALSALFAELRAARMAAISENRQVALELDCAHKLFFVKIDRNGNASYEADETIRLAISSSDAVSVSAAVTNGTFNPRGNFTCAAGYWKIGISANGADDRFVYVFQSGQVQQSDESL